MDVLDIEQVDIMHCMFTENKECFIHVPGF